MLRSLLWTCRLQIWPSTQSFQTEWLIVLAQRPKMRYICVRKYPKLLENTNKLYAFFFPKCFSGIIEAILENSGKNFWQKAEKLALKVFERFKIEYLSKKSIFIKMFLWAQRKHSRQLWQKVFGRRPLTLQLVSLKHLKLNYLSKHSYSFSSNYSSGH